MTPTFSTDEVLKRLEVLWRKLEDEGLYVRANTVALAIEAIKRKDEALRDIASHDLIGLRDPYRAILRAMIDTAKAATGFSK